MDTETLTAQNKGRKVRDLSDAGQVKTVESFGLKYGSSEDEDGFPVEELLINFTDGTWAYAESTQPV